VWLDACLQTEQQDDGDPVNLRRLKYFVKIVDVGSLTQASEVLHVAQPALSQQLATLKASSTSACCCERRRAWCPPKPAWSCIAMRN
jgi:LysR family nitrogen assimilation transcriptional regulator